MIQLEFGGAAVRRSPPVRRSSGRRPDSAVVLEGEGVQPRHAVVQGTAAGGRRHPRGRARGGGAGQRRAARGRAHAAAARRQDPDRRRTSSSWWIDRPGRQHPALRLRRLRRPGRRRPRPAAPPGRRGGRLVCLTDGREYTIAGGPLVFGRDAELRRRGRAATRCRAAMPRSSRTARATSSMDPSVNGTYVNGERIAGSHAAGPGRRDPDRARRVPVLRRCRAGAAEPRRRRGVPPRPPSAADRGAAQPAVRHDARRCRRAALRAAAATPPQPRRRRSRRCWSGAARSRAGGCRSRCRW